jgi:putative ABC transport system permease protein
VLGTPPLVGRAFSPEKDLANGPRAVVISERLWKRRYADRFLPGVNPIQQHLKVRTGAFEIVGVVADVRELGYAKDPIPTIYFCEIPGYFPDPVFMVKTAAAPALMVEPLRRLQALEPNRAVYDPRPLAEYLTSTLDERRFQTTLLSLFGLTALGLATVGLYGVTSFFVSQRSREIGLRSALGAQPGQILAHVFRQGALMAGIGIAAGVAGAAVLARSLGSLLFGIAAVDPVTFMAMPLLLAAVAAAAIWLPAHRATRVDPMEALRQD